MHDAVIVEAVRTPVGRGYADKGYYGALHPADMLGRCFVEVLARAGVDPNEVDNVLGGCVHQIGEQSNGITRNAWLQKGLPAATGATTIDTRCGSSQQAIGWAATRIQVAIDDVVVAGGVEHMGHVGFPVNEATQQQYGRGQTKELLDRYALVSQGEAAELIAEQWELGRKEMDELALRSHTLAHQATVGGRFAREILPMAVNGEVHTMDQGIRPNTSLDALAGLKPAFRPDGMITAGNASQISDGAAALLLTSAEKARSLGLKARVKVIDQVALGVDPVTMLTGPIHATAKILERNRMTIDDIDLFEVNEAFAAVVLAWAREHEPDMDRVNIRGGAIALGHPLGATGARLMTTLVHALEDEDKEVGLLTMCCGGGIGTATLVRRI